MATSTVRGSNATGNAPVVNTPSCRTESRATCFFGSRTGSSSMHSRPCFACMSCPGEYDSTLYVAAPRRATLATSTCPTRSFTDRSGVASTYRNLSAPGLHSIRVSRPPSPIASMVSGLTWNAGLPAARFSPSRAAASSAGGRSIGQSLVALPRTTGIAESSVAAIVLARSVFACPTWPTSSMSCPASRALSTAGSTVSPNPSTPGYAASPAARRAARLRRSWALAGTRR